jgi:DNA-binding response OmpR family regulator
VTTENINKAAAGHILLAENDRGLQIILQLMLREAGFRVTVCKTSDETFETISSMTADDSTIDLLVLDLQTQELGGYELLTRLTEFSFRFPILTLTEGTDDENGISAEKNVHTLSKPFAPQTLMEKIHHILTQV